MRNFPLIYIAFLCASVNSLWQFVELAAAAPQSSNQTKNDFHAADVIDPKDIPKIFRCGFAVVDEQFNGNEDLLRIWNEYKSFLEFLTNKVEACINKHGESQAESCYVKRGLLFGAIIDELSERIGNISPEIEESLDRLVKEKCVPPHRQNLEFF